MTLHRVSQSISIAAEPRAVWAALTSRDAGDKWRNAHFKTDWQVGAPIEIEAIIGSRRYRDKGQVVQVQLYRLLQYTYWSSVSGLPDRPESYSTVTMNLEAGSGDNGPNTILTVEQNVPPSPMRKGLGWEIGEESGAKHIAFYWRMVLPILKRVVEEEQRRS